VDELRHNRWLYEAGTVVAFVLLFMTVVARLGG
jgi:hypothetical protein